MDGRRPEKRVEMAKSQIPWPRSQNRPLDAAFPLQVQAPQAKDRHPEDRAGTGIDGRELQFLSANPELGCRGRSRLHGRAAVVNRNLGVQRKKEHEAA